MTPCIHTGWFYASNISCFKLIRRTGRSRYASASEAARRGEGDCSEHGVLLAAVLRADAIPSRVCSGIVYTERAAHSYAQAAPAEGRSGPSVQGSFAWHAWTQALIGGRCVSPKHIWFHMRHSLLPGIIAASFTEVFFTASLLTHHMLLSTNLSFDITSSHAAFQ